MQPRRKIRPTGRSVSGVHAFRSQTGIPYESTPERDFLIRIESFRSVAEIIPQPIQISFRTASGREATYTPDFLVAHRLGNRAYPESPKPRLVESQAEQAVASALAHVEPEVARRADASRVVRRSLPVASSWWPSAPRSGSRLPSSRRACSVPKPAWRSTRSA